MPPGGPAPPCGARFRAPPPVRRRARPLLAQRRAIGPRGRRRGGRSWPAPPPLPLVPPRSHAEVRPHFDGAARGRQTAGRPLERLVEVGHVDDVVAAKLLLRVGERPVLDLTRAMRLPDRRRRRWRLEPG